MRCNFFLFSQLKYPRNLLGSKPHLPAEGLWRRLDPPNIRSLRFQTSVVKYRLSIDVIRKKRKGVTSVRVQGPRHQVPYYGCRTRACSRLYRSEGRRHFMPVTFSPRPILTSFPMAVSFISLFAVTPLTTYHAIFTSFSCFTNSRNACSRRDGGTAALPTPSDLAWPYIDYTRVAAPFSFKSDFTFSVLLIRSEQCVGGSPLALPVHHLRFRRIHYILSFFPIA